MDIFTEMMQPVVNWLHNHPNWAGFITFFVSFSESLAIIGSIVPGSVTMTAIGILAGAGVIPITSTYVWAILGAIAGDSASYFLGYYYRDRIQEFWPFRKYPQIIRSGKAFFELHGGKSVFIGRFLGPLRAIVPIIAGMVKMPNSRFLVANITSAIIWSFLYVTPGILLGAATSDLSAETASKLFLYVLAILFGIWLLAVFIKYLARKISLFLDRHLSQFWQWMSKHPKLESITQAIANPNKPHAYTPIALLLFAIIFLFSFIILTILVSYTDVFTSTNHMLFHLLQSIRIITLDKIFLFISVLADKKILLALLGFLFIYLLARRQYRTAFFWLSNGVITAGAIFLIKLLVASSRPEGLVLVRDSYSFPSGHTTLATAIYGFIAYLIAKPTLSTMRRLILIPIGSYLILVGFSRLYLGAHWLSDILGAYCLGLSVVLTHVMLYQRKNFKSISKYELILVISSFLTVSSIVYCYHGFTTELSHSQLKKEVKTIRFKNWWNAKTNLFPSKRRNRLGHAISPLNLQWSSKLKAISSSLEKAGWKPISHRTMTQAITILVNGSKKHDVPLIPHLYKNQYPKLIMYRKTSDDAPILVLRLWPSLYQFKNRHSPLWIGSVNYRIQYKHAWHPFKKTELISTKPLRPRHLLKDVITHYHWKILSNRKEKTQILLIRD